MRIGFSSALYTHAPSHSCDVGQTRAQLAPTGLASMIVLALPSRSPVPMRPMKRGTSIPVGHARTQGGS